MLVVAIDEHRHQERPDARDGRTLRGRKDARQDAAQNDDDGDEAPHRLVGDAQRLPEA